MVLRSTMVAGLFLLILVLMPTLAIVSNTQITSSYLWIKSTHIKVPAVTTIGGEERGGVVADLYVSIAYPGTGTVYFSAEPLTELDTQATARIAALIAATIAGRNFNSYDYFIKMESSSLIIGGPSAGAAMTVALLSLFLNQSLRPDVMMTGMICPDGSIGPVGGIPAKLRAAVATGAKVFLIPIGQRVVYVRRIIKEPIPGGYLVRTEYVPVDVVELGRQLNVTVIEVSSVREAFYYFTGMNISLPSNITLPELPKEAINIVSSWTRDYLTRSDNARSQALELSKKIPYPIRYIIEKHLNKSVTYAKLATTAMISEAYYEAASYAFTSYIEGLTALEYAKVYLNNSRLPELVNEVNNTIRATRSIVMSGEAKTFAEFEALLAARYRYYLATIMFNKSVDLLRKGITSWSDLDNLVYMLAYAKARADSAKQWLMIAKIDTPVINAQAVKSIAESLLAMAKSSFSYLEALVGDVGAKPPSYDEALTNVELAVEAFHNNDTYGSIATSIHAVAASVVAIHELFKTGIGGIIQVVEKETKASIRDTYDIGTLPLIALNYIELAEAHKSVEGEWATAIYYYMLASLHAQVLKALIEASIPKPQVNVTVTALPTIVVTRRETVTATTTVTSYVDITHTTTIEKTVTTTTTTTTTMTATTTTTSTATVEKTITTTKTQTIVRVGWVTITETTMPISDYLGYLILELLVGLALGIVVIGVALEIRKRRMK